MLFSPKTIKCIHGVLHKVLSKAVGLGYLQRNPADGCTLPEIELPEVEPLSNIKTAEFLKAIKNDTYNQVYMLALFMGLRQGEILGLAWDCINWENNVITIKRQLIRKRDYKIIENTDDDDKKYKLTTVKDKDARYICVDDEIMDIFRT